VSDCAVYGLSDRAKITVTGADRMRWLNGMVTNNIRDLPVGRGVYAFLLNPQGHILGDLYAYNRGDSLILDTEHSQLEKLLSIFDHYIIMDDVEVAEVSSKLTALGITGPRARAVLRSAGVEFPDLEPMQFADVTWKGAALTVVRKDNPGVETYEMWLEPANVTSLKDALIESGAKPVGATVLELFRIACGIPCYGQDIRERDLPQETEQARALHFSKGCYIGQEIVERIRSRGAVHRSFTGFEVQGELPAPGAKVQAEGKEVGEITSVASLPCDGRPRQVALGYIRREWAQPGKRVQAGDAQLCVASLPFTAIFGAKVDQH